MSKTIIPFISVRQVNQIEDYERFYHLKTYIKCKSDRYKDTGRKKNPVIVELVKKSGYSKYQKFREHRKDWNNIKRDIPILYLKSIGVDLEVIEDLVKVDLEEFEKVLEIPLFPTCGVIRYMACVYGTKEFESGTTEEEAIEILKEFTSIKRIRCCINYPYLKTIFVEPNGDVFYHYYRPSVKFTKNKLVLKKDGNGIGTSYI
jgi:hypothetical protein